MKAITKFLTALSPVAVAGTIVPTAISCGGKTFVINYGDSVNCRDKKADNYHKLSKVQDAVKVKANKHERAKLDPEDVALINNSVASSNQGIQMFYFDLLATFVLLDKAEIILSGWSADMEESPYTVSFTINGEIYEDKTINYGFDENNKMLMYCGDLKKQSYVFSDCTPEQE